MNGCSFVPNDTCDSPGFPKCNFMGVNIIVTCLYWKSTDAQHVGVCQFYNWKNDECTNLDAMRDAETMQKLERL